MAQPERTPDPNDQPPGNSGGGGGGGSPFWIYLLAVAVLVTGTILILNWLFPSALSVQGNQFHLIYLLVLAGYLVLVLRGMGKIGARTWLISIATWLGLLVGLVVLFDLIKDIPGIREWMEGRF